MEVVIKVNTWADIEVLLPIFERLGITLPQNKKK
jgi:hypothetical protein